MLIYLIGINIVVLFIYVTILNQPTVILEQNILLKSIKGILYFLFICLYVMNVNTYINKIPKEHIFKPFNIASILIFAILILEISFPGIFNQIFHNGQEYNRIRLLTSESSFTAAMIFIYPIMSIYYYKYENISKNKSMCFIFMLIIFILTSGSKSILINIPIALIILFLGVLIRKILYKSERKINLVKTIGIIISIGISIVLFTPKIIELAGYLQRDLQEYTSIITRFYTILIGFIIMIKFPFGIGNAIYLKVFPEMLSKYLYMISGKGYNLMEINGFINSKSDDLLSVKSGIGQYSMYWGVIGTIIFISFIIKIYKNLFKCNFQGKYLLLMLYLITAVGIVDFIYFDSNYEIWAMIVVIQYLIRENK